VPKVQPATEAPSGRAARGRRVSTTLAEINVVPLVDVMLVLLIIFMVTAPMIQRGVDVNLPITAHSTQVVGERVFVTVPGAYRQNRMVYLDNDQIRVDALQERIRQKMQTLNDKEVFLRGDGDVRLQELMDVFDRLKAAGVQKVGIVTKQPGER
jgi:biopolymer transport protein ExbD